MNKKLLFSAAFLGLSTMASAQLFQDDFADDTKWTIDNGVQGKAELGARIWNPITDQGTNVFSIVRDITDPEDNSSFMPGDYSNIVLPYTYGNINIMKATVDGVWYYTMPGADGSGGYAQLPVYSVERDGDGAPVFDVDGNVVFSTNPLLDTEIDNYGYDVLNDGTFLFGPDGGEDDVVSENPFYMYFASSAQTLSNVFTPSNGNALSFNNYSYELLKIYDGLTGEEPYWASGQIGGFILQSPTSAFPFTVENNTVFNLTDPADRSVSLSFYEYGLAQYATRTVEISTSENGVDFGDWMTVNTRAIYGESYGIDYETEWVLSPMRDLYYYGTEFGDATDTWVPLTQEEFSAIPGAFAGDYVDPASIQYTVTGDTAFITQASLILTKTDVNASLVNIRFDEYLSDVTITDYKFRFKYTPNDVAADNGDWHIDDVVLDYTPALNVAVTDAFHGTSNGVWFDGLEGFYEEAQQWPYFNQLSLNNVSTDDVVKVGAQLKNMGGSTIILDDTYKATISVKDASNNEVYTDVLNLNTQNIDIAAAETAASHIVFDVPVSVLTSTAGQFEEGDVYTYEISFEGADLVDVLDQAIGSATGSFKVHPNVMSRENGDAEIIPLYNNGLGFWTNASTESEEFYGNIASNTGEETEFVSYFTANADTYIDTVYVYVRGLRGVADIGTAEWSVKINYSDAEGNVQTLGGTSNFTLSPSDTSSVVAVPMNEVRLYENILVYDNGIPVGPSNLSDNDNIYEIVLKADVENSNYYIGVDFQESLVEGRSYVDRLAIFDNQGAALPYYAYLPYLRTSSRDAQVLGLNDKKMDASFETSIYPNPTSANATVTYALTEKSNVTIEVRDITGKLIISENRGVEAKGNKSFELNTEVLRAGIYFYSVETANAKVTKRFSVVK